MTTLHSETQRKPAKRRNEEDVKIRAVRFDREKIYVALEDEREVSAPLWWYPRLYRATQAQRKQWELCAGGRGIHWPGLDEDLSALGFLHGLKSPGAKPPGEG